MSCNFVADAIDAGNALEACFIADSADGQIDIDEVVATPVTLQSFSVD